MPRGRPLKPVDPDASAGHRLGYEIRSLRLDRGLTLEQLAGLSHYTMQHISQVELARTTVSEHLVMTLDRALDADGGSRRCTSRC